MELDFHALEVSAVEDGHFVPWDAFFVVEFLHALGDEHGLFLRGVEGGHDWLVLEAGAGRLEGFGELAGIEADGGVGDGEDFRGAAVIGFDFEDLGTGVAFGEADDVSEVGAAP